MNISNDKHDAIMMMNWIRLYLSGSNRNSVSSLTPSSLDLVLGPNRIHPRAVCTYIEG